MRTSAIRVRRFPHGNPGPSQNPPENFTRYRCAVCRERYHEDSFTLTEPDDDRQVCDYCREREGVA